MTTKEEDHFSEGRKVLDMVALEAAITLALGLMQQESQDPTFQAEVARRGLTPEDVREQIDRVVWQLLYIQLIAVEEAMVRGSRATAETSPAGEDPLPGVSDEELAKQVEHAIFLATDNEEYNQSIRGELRGGE